MPKIPLILWSFFEKSSSFQEDFIFLCKGFIVNLEVQHNIHDTDIKALFEIKVSHV